MKFLTEIQKPVAIALDLLQGDTMYGETLPAIHSLYQHLEQLLEAPENCIAYKRYLIRGLLDSMMARETRFRNLLNLNYHEDYETKVAILAAVSHPKFKNRFIRRRCSVSVQVVNDLFFYALKVCSRLNQLYPTVMILSCNIYILKAISLRNLF